MINSLPYLHKSISRMLKSRSSHPRQPGALCHPPALRLPRQPPYPGHACSHAAFHVVQILDGDPSASPLGGAHRRGAPYSSHRAPQGVCLWLFTRCGLAWDRRVSARRGGRVEVWPYERPAVYFCCRVSRTGYRCSCVPKWFPRVC